MNIENSFVLETEENIFLFYNSLEKLIKIVLFEEKNRKTIY